MKKEEFIQFVAKNIKYHLPFVEKCFSRKLIPIFSTRVGKREKNDV